MASRLPTQYDFQPVIILGAARSGTNMLRDAMSRLDGTATWPCDEINAIWRHYWAAWPSDELRTVHATPRACRFIRHEFQRLAHRVGARWVIEKTCANSLRVDFVRTILPEAKFVLILRDGRDVVASAIKRWHAAFELRYSLMKLRYVPLGDIPRYGARFVSNRLRQVFARDKRLKSWGPRFEGIDTMLATHSLAEVCAEQWSRCVLLAARSLAAMPVGRVCVVRYENLVGESAHELARIATFLGITPRTGQIDRIAASCTADSVGKWRRELDAEALKVIEPRIRQTMQVLGTWEVDRDARCVRSAA
jgi:hypothetical protein